MLCVPRFMCPQNLHRIWFVKLSCTVCKVTDSQGDVGRHSSDNSRLIPRYTAFSRETCNREVFPNAFQNSGCAAFEARASESLSAGRVLSLRLETNSAFPLRYYIYHIFNADFVIQDLLLFFVFSVHKKINSLMSCCFLLFFPPCFLGKA